MCIYIKMCISTHKLMLPSPPPPTLATGSIREAQIFHISTLTLSTPACFSLTMDVWKCGKRQKLPGRISDFEVQIASGECAKFYASAWVSLKNRVPVIRVIACWDLHWGPVVYPSKDILLYLHISIWLVGAPEPSVPNPKP